MRPGPGPQVPFICDKATIYTQKLIQNPIRRVIDINLKSTVVETCLWLTTTVVGSRFYRLESPSRRRNLTSGPLLPVVSVPTRRVVVVKWSLAALV